MNVFSKASLLAIALIMGASHQADAQVATISNVSELNTPAAPTTNIRYVDMDVISAKYTLAVEYQEWATLASDSVKNVLTAKYKEVTDFEAKCQKKLQNNQYKSDQAVRNDQKKLQKMAEDAQKLEQTLTAKFNAENGRRMQQLQDSIISYISDYNATHRYDAILYKSAGVLFNPALDITTEIVIGLNKRYSKPKEITIPLPDKGLVPQKAEDNTATP